jgi:hypothetical protein
MRKQRVVCSSEKGVWTEEMRLGQSRSRNMMVGGSQGVLKECRRKQLLGKRNRMRLSPKERGFDVAMVMEVVG